MVFLETETEEVRAHHVRVDEESLIVDLVDSRTLIVPLIWYPRLWHAMPEEREHFEIISDGELLHWPDLDEDLSIVGLLEGRRSGESPQSLKNWLDERKSKSSS